MPSAAVTRSTSATQRVVVVAALRVPGRVAVAAVIERERAVVGRDARREVVPDVRVVAEAVEQQQRHALVAPLEQVELEIVAPSRARLAWRGMHRRASVAQRAQRPRSESLSARPAGVPSEVR